MNTTQSTTSIFAPRRLGHVNLVVNDTDSSMNFYQSVIGFNEVYRVVAILGGFLSNGNTHHDIGMVQSSGTSGRGRAPGLNHLAFELENEVALVKGYEKALEQQVAIERTLDHDIAHSVYIADPDGNSCELYADVIKDWRNARTGLITKPKPKWWPGATEPIKEAMYDPNPTITTVEHAIFHPVKTTHASLLVSNLQKSVDFYLSIIGLHIVSGSVEQGYVQLAGSTKDVCMILIQKSDFQEQGMHHVGVLVAETENLRNSIEKCKKDNPSILKKIVETKNQLSVFIEDMNGIRFKLYSIKDQGQKDQLQDEILWM